MVLDKNLKVLHELTSQGKDVYKRFLEALADEIIFKHEHPFKWVAQKIKQAFCKE